MRTTWFTRVAGFGLAMAVVFMPAMKAQTVMMSNEHLVSTTLVANRTGRDTECNGYHCVAPPVPMFKPIHVTCPAALGKTCTLNIVLDTKTGLQDDSSEGPAGRYQILVDGTAPLPGPTDGHGFYVFSVYAPSLLNEAERQAYSASVIGKVTNKSSKDHKIDVKVSCTDAANTGACDVEAHWSTMRIDVFEP